jgi:tetratricopeptide (TPR) repeat protein
VHLAATSPAERLIERLDVASRAQCLYVRDELVAARAQEDTFQVTDSHWTDWGAYVGYRACADVLAARCPEIAVLDAQRVAWTTRRSFGMLGLQLEPERAEHVRVATVSESRCRTTEMVSTESRDAYMVIEQDRPDLPTALVFRDSFMTSAYKFFAESFRRAVFVSHANSVMFDLVERESPDVVIFEVVERRLAWPPSEPSLLDFRTIFGDLLVEDDTARAAQLASRSLARQGDVAGALAASDDAHAAAAPNARQLLHRAQLLAEAGSDRAALEAVRTATTVDPDDSAVWYHFAVALRRVGRTGEAAAAAVKAARAEPRQAAFWIHAISLTAESDVDELSVSLTNEALGHHRDDPDLLYAHSAALVAAGDLAAAEQAARRTINAVPGTARYLRQLASVLIRRGDWPSAKACLAELTSVDVGTPGLDGYVALVDRQLEAAQ